MFSRKTMLILAVLTVSPALGVLDAMDPDSLTEPKRIVQALGEFSTPLVNFYIEQCAQEGASEPVKVESSAKNYPISIIIIEPEPQIAAPQKVFLCVKLLRETREYLNDTAASEQLCYKMLRAVDTMPAHDLIRKGLDASMRYEGSQEAYLHKDSGTSFFKEEFEVNTAIPLKDFNALIDKKRWELATHK